MAFPYSPFVLNGRVGQSILKAIGPTLLEAEFTGKSAYSLRLGGEFPSGAAAKRFEEMVGPDSTPVFCCRLHFSLPRRGQHAELFVKVPEEVCVWKYHQVFNLWFRGVSTSAKLYVSFSDAQGQRWFFPQEGILSGGQWVLLRVPLSHFMCPEELRTDNVQHRDHVTELSVQVAWGERAQRCRGYLDVYQAFLSH